MALPCGGENKFTKASLSSFCILSSSMPLHHSNPTSCSSLNILFLTTAIHLVPFPSKFPKPLCLPIFLKRGKRLAYLNQRISSDQALVFEAVLPPILTCCALGHFKEQGTQTGSILDHTKLNNVVLTRIQSIKIRPQLI